MSKKRGKSSSAGGAAGKWETGLVAAPLQDEHWTASVNFLIENQIEDSEHIKPLTQAIKVPQRKLFSILSMQELMEMVDELGNPKNRKTKDLPQYFEVTEVVKGLMDGGQEIPVNLWAKLIKFGLLNIRDKDLKRRTNEVKAATDKAKGGSGKKRPRSKSPGKKGKKTPDAQLPKKDWSTLKKRGEEDTDSKYIDDEPDDGPHHYIFVTGFYKAQVLSILAEMDIHLNSIIKISSENYDTMKEEVVKENNDENKDEEALALAKAEHESRVNEIAVFWKLLPHVLLKTHTTSPLQDIANLDYVVTETIHPSDWTDQEKLLGYGTTLFEDLACLVYDSLDWRRQYLNFLQNMNLVRVAKFGEVPPTEVPAQMSGSEQAASSPPGKKDKSKTSEPPMDDLVPPILSIQSIPDIDMRCYNDLMSAVPQESVSVPIIMHCMLEQVVATEKSATDLMETPRAKIHNGIHMELYDCITDALGDLPLSEEEKASLAVDFPDSLNVPKQEESDPPTLLLYGDDCMMRTHHLKKHGEFDIRKSEEKMLQRMLVANLKYSHILSSQEMRERATRSQELFQHCSVTDSNQMVSNAEIDRAFRQFVFETMAVAKADESDGRIQIPNCDENMFDDPYHTTTTMQSNNKDSLSVPGSAAQPTTDAVSPPSVNINSDDQSKNLDDWCFAEHYQPDVLLQVLNEAHQSYPMLDTHYHRRDNSVLAMFHAPMNKKLLATKKWHAKLFSDVGFRNYLEYISESIADWTKTEEYKRHAELISQELEKARQAQSAGEGATTTPASGIGKRPKSKSPKSKSPKKGSRKGSASRSSSKGALNEDGHSYTSPFIRPGSLKAQAEENARMKEEERRLQAEKEAKQHAKSAVKKTKSAASKTSQDTKRPGSGKRPKSGRKSKSRSRSTSPKERKEVPSIQEPEEDAKPELPFVGYDVGNNLININGTDSYLYPCDGGIIQAEKVEYEHGKTFVTISLLKDGHKFMVHMVGPCQTEKDELLFPNPIKIHDESSSTEVTEKADLENSEKDESAKSQTTSPEQSDKLCHSEFGSWVANLCDGMTLSMSSHGDAGTCDEVGKREAQILQLIGEIPSATSPSPVPPGMESPKGKKGKGKSPRGRSPRGKSPKGKKKDSEKDQEAQRLEEKRLQEELDAQLKEQQRLEEERLLALLPKLQKLFVSTPDGLAVRYMIDPESADENDQYKLMVRQSYPYKTAGIQDTEKWRQMPAMQEMSRCIRSDGTVIKLMLDGSTQVLFADGSTYYNAGHGPLLTDDKVPITPRSTGGQSIPTQDETLGRPIASAGSKKGSKGRKSSGKATTDATATEPSMGGAGTGAAAKLEADAGAKAEADEEKAASWITTQLDGERLLWKPNGDFIPQTTLLAYKATDPVTAEVLTSRKDHVVHVARPDASTVCEHSDGTRITTYERKVDKSVFEDSIMTTTVRHVRVECPGFATVTFNSDEGSCLTTFGSGTTLLASTDSSYQLTHWNGGRIDIDPQSAVSYIPRPDNDLFAAYNAGVEEGEDGTMQDQRMDNVPMSSTYVMKHDSDVCIEAVDHEGNVFQVDKYGSASVINPSVELTNSEGNIETTVSQALPNPLDHHPPRLFVIYNNGSGSELLRYKDVHEYLVQAEIDPSTAVIREPLPDMEGVIGITVMRPHFGNSGDAWLVQKTEDNIVPENIRSIDLESIKSSNVRATEGPKFASTVGKGLSIGSMQSQQNIFATECPNVLELRQLVQFTPVSADLRKHLKQKLSEYCERTQVQQMQQQQMQKDDPRSEEEKIRASDLLSLVLEFDEQPSPHAIPQISNGPEQMNIASKAAATSNQELTHAAREIYENAIQPPPVPQPEPPKPRLTQDDWDNINKLLAAELSAKTALKNRTVPAYFFSKQGKAWLERQKTSQTQDKNNDEKSTDVESSTESENFFTNAQSKTRPMNPTPGHAEGSGTPTAVRPNNPTPVAASQTKTVRPSNPTPSKAAANRSNNNSGAPYQPSPIPENPTSAQVREDQGTSEVPFMNGSNDDIILTRSLLYDHTGQPRKNKVKLPTSILSDKPITVANEQFISVEESVRRKVNTSSVAGSRGKVVRGFELLPPEIVFGELKEGNTYSYTARLKNTGVDGCRFKIKQPPPGTGLRVHYQPGPVAAGMETLLHVECYAIAVGVEGDWGHGTINHQLEIITEVESLFLPITAIVLTAHAFDKTPNAKKAPGVKHLSSIAPSRGVILRPFKGKQETEA